MMIGANYTIKTLGFGVYQGCQSCQNVLPNKKVINEEKNLNLHAEYFNLVHKRAEIKIGKN